MNVQMLMESVHIQNLPQQLIEEVHEQAMPPMNGEQGLLCNFEMGRQIQQPAQVGDGSLRLTDDDFFHLTCHIDANLTAKIERGEYVDLKKMLPKNGSRSKYSEDTRLEWVHRDGCCDIGQIDIFSRIELNPSFVLSSDETDCKNDIQLFHQLFDELRVNGDYH